MFSSFRQLRQYLPSAQTTLVIASAALGFLGTLYLTSDDTCQYQYEVETSNCVETQLQRYASAFITASVLGIFSYLGSELKKEHILHPNLFIEAERRNLENRLRDMNSARLSSVLENSRIAAPAA